MRKGSFLKRNYKEISLGSTPKINDKIWMDITSGIIYNYDDTRGKWLSTAKYIFEFARSGNADGIYLPLLGDLSAAEDVYRAGKNLTIISLNCSIRDLQKNKPKGFEIHINGHTIHEFFCNEQEVCYNSELNYDMSSSDRLQVFVVYDGNKAKNVVCRVETAWRYDL